MTRNTENALSLGLYDTDYTDGFAIQVPGEDYPRIHITANGKVKTGDGTAPPTELSGGGTFGTTAGTYAEGNDSRITGAAQKASNLSDLASAATARTNLGLGTAATTASSDYATAAQGVLAGTAVQPARTITAGTGLSGGGDLSANRTLTLDTAYLADVRWISIVPTWQRPRVVAGSWANASDSAMLTAGYATTTTQNTEWEYDVWLTAGTWDVEILSRNSTNTGIVDCVLAGSSIGSIDTYAASTTRNVLNTISGISVATTGRKTLNLKNATKNGSSSAYNMLLSAITFRRTA